MYLSNVIQKYLKIYKKIVGVVFMPNNIINNLVIVGKRREDIFDFRLKYNINNYFDFNNVIPEPKSIEECEESFIINEDDIEKQKELNDKWFNWYDWRVHYWNTKWNSYNNEINQYMNILHIKFETAWNEPIPIIDKLKRDNKDYIIVNYNHDEYESHPYLKDQLEVKKNEELLLLSKKLTLSILKDIKTKDSPIIKYLEDEINSIESNNKKTYDETREKVINVLSELNSKYYYEYLDNSNDNIKHHKSNDAYKFDKYKIMGKQECISEISELLDIGCIEYNTNNSYSSKVHPYKFDLEK